MTRAWSAVSRRDPCPVCGQPDWCAVSSDGRVARCMRIVDGPDVIAREDSAGVPYGLAFLTDGPRDPSRYRPAPEPTRADDETLHRVYCALLGVLALSPAHRASLRARNLDNDAIDALGYRTLPPDRDRRRVVGQLKSALGGKIPDDVPGIYGGRLAGYAGILIPVRTGDGRVRALKIRSVDPSAPKYTWLSSQDGPSSGAPCHVPVSTGCRGEVRITEGPLKADVATHLSGLLTLGIAGCSSARSAVEHMKALRVERVRLAWDMDAHDNPHVAAGLRLAAKIYREEGFAVAIETWDQSAGKGIDDALAAGAAITAHAGDAVDRVLAGMAQHSSNLRVPAPTAPGAAKPAPAPVDVAAAVRARGQVSFDRGDSVELARALLAELRSTAPDAGDDAVIYDRSAFWVYDSARGIYVERSASEMLVAVARYAGAPCGPKGKPLSLSDAAVKGAVKAASWLCARPGYLSAAPRGIVFADRFVTAVGGEVITRPHSHEHRAIHALGVEYEMDAPRHRWTSMLREVFRRQREDGTLDEDDTEACIELLQEWVGSTLMGEATARAVSLVLVGAGNDGKSSVLSVIRALFPASAVCSITPQDWARGFLLAGLAGKRLNAVSELPERDILDSERFKAVVSGDPLTAERKNQDPIDLNSEAGHHIACNALPATRDQSVGFWRRFAVLACTRSFAADEAVRDLWKIVVAEELAGIAAWAIEGAARAQTLKTFTAPESSTQAKAEWQHDSDAVRQFVEEACVVLPAGSPSSDETNIANLYTAFRAWSASTGHATMARDRLARRLKGLGFEHRTKSARLYRLHVSESWATDNGLTKPAAGGYRAFN